MGYEKLSIARRYLLIRPSRRMVIEWLIFIGVGVVGTITSQPLIPFHPITNMFGAAILVIGFIIHGSAHKIHKNAHEPADKIEGIVTSDIYSKVRHPCYSGLVMIYFGSAILWGILWLLIPAAVFSILIFFTAIEEEKFLKERLGREYEEYTMRVRWRFIPGVL